MKALEKIGISVVVLLLCIVSVILILMGIAHEWQASVEPLSLEELDRLSPVVVSDTYENAETRTEETVGQSGQPASGDAGQAQSADEGKDLYPPKPTALASQPTEEQRLRKVSRDWPIEDSERLRWRAKSFATKLVGSAIYRARPGATDNTTCSIPGQIGRFYAYLGDFDTARNFLREAVRVEKIVSNRRYSCGLLAWLEEDPEVAARLLEQSCEGNEITGRDERREALNALELAVITESEELAGYWYRRYRDSWQDWLEPYVLSAHPEVRAWLEGQEVFQAHHTQSLH